MKSQSRSRSQLHSHHGRGRESRILEISCFWWFWVGDGARSRSSTSSVRRWAWSNVRRTIQRIFGQIEKKFYILCTKQGARRGACGEVNAKCSEWQKVIWLLWLNMFCIQKYQLKIKAVQSRIIYFSIHQCKDTRSDWQPNNKWPWDIDPDYKSAGFHRFGVLDQEHIWSRHLKTSESNLNTSIVLRISSTATRPVEV